MDKNSTYNYWINQAKKEQESPSASWDDSYMMELEAKEIKKFIKNEYAILDAGCGNGFSTIKMFSDKSKNQLVAFDYVSEMVKICRKRFKVKSFKNLSHRIYKADIREIPEDDNTFDVSYTIRVLISLPNWEEQEKGIKELIRVTKPKGIIIISEGFWGSFQNLNALRIIAGLKPLVEHDFNKYLKEENLEKFLDELKINYEINKFSSVYYLGTRCIRELDSSLPIGFNNEINKDFFNLSLKYIGGDFGIQKQYILKNK